VTTDTEPLGPVDNAWLRMERPDSPMVITGILTFGEHVPHEALRGLVVERLLRFRRFRQRVVRRGLRDVGYWEDAPDFDVDAHLVEEKLEAPGDRTTVSRRVNEIMSQPLGLDRPPWRLHHLVGFDGDKSLLVCRLHHCIADGFALMHVMMSLTDEDPDEEGRTAEPSRAATRGRRLGDAETVSARVVEAASRLSTGLRHLLFMSNEPPSPFRAELTGAKRAAWSRPIPLDRIKAIGHAHGGTVNDVLLAAATGALRRHAISRGHLLSDAEIRAIVPVALRDRSEMEELGNYFGLVFLELPIGVHDPRARLLAVEERVAKLKKSGEALLAYYILALAGVATRFVEDLVVRIFGAKTSLVVTNVPGPTVHRRLVGHRLETIMFWVPQSAKVGLGVSLFSYAGAVRIGVAADLGITDDPEAIVAAFADELDALEAVNPTSL
jgi:WS/DGAT/MGAT family acyltransferase